MKQSEFPFVLLAFIGKGTSAQVWRARHLSSGHEVALKVFKQEERSSNQMEEFFRETRFVARSAHEHILRVWGYGRSTHTIEHDGEVVLAVNQLYLVSEYARGGSLEPQIGQLEWAQVRIILLELLSGLGRIHARGIVHLDLKPANVLRSERGVLISDFGVAAPIVSAELPQRDDGLFGTPSYMSPEQGVSHSHLYGPWTDLYGLGCLAVVLITGSTPYTTDGLVEQLIAHRTEPVPSLEGGGRVPRGFDLWLVGMMNKSWNRRFQRAVEARRYLESLDSNELIQSQKPQARLVECDTVEISKRQDTANQNEQTLAEEPWHEFATVRLAAGQALHSTQQLICDGQSFAETIMVPYEVIEQGSRPVIRLEGMGHALIGIEDARLVGRNAEKRALWSQFSQHLAQPKTGIIQISAAAGMGKTALCDWFTTAAHEFAGAETLWFTHAPTAGPSDGVLNGFRSYFSLFGVEKEGYARRVAQRLCLPEDDSLVADLARLFEMLFVDESTLEHGDVLSMYERFSTLSQLLIYLAVRRPTVMIVDDVQWAFETLQFLDVYLKHSASTPVFIIATRQTDVIRVPARLQQLYATLSDSLAWTHSMDLGPLDRESVSKWVRDSLGPHASPSVAVVNSVAGNPLSIKALLYTAGAHLSDDDVLAHPSLEVLLCRQFTLWCARAPHHSVLALQVLAILGRTCRVEEWIGVMGRLGKPTSLSTLTPAIEGQLIERDRHGQIKFVHRAILDAALAGLNQAETLSIHKETAVFLEDEPSPDYARVAHHYTQSQAHATAGERWFRTALLCRDRSDYPNFRWALLKAANSFRNAKINRSSEQWLELCIHWVLCRRVMGEASWVQRRSKMNVARAKLINNDSLIAHALREHARLHRVIGGYSASLPIMSKALDFALCTDDTAAQTVLRTDLATLCVHTGRLDEAQRLLEQVKASLESGFAGQSVRHSVDFFQLSSTLASRLGNKQEALRLAEASYLAVEHSPSNRSKGHALNMLGEAQRRLAHYEQAIRSYQKAAECYCAIESIDTPIIFLNQAFIHCETGRYEAAGACAASARRWLADSSVIVQTLCDFIDAMLHLFLGRASAFDQCEHVLVLLASSNWGEADLVRLAEIGVNLSVQRGHKVHAQRCLRVFENQLEQIGDLESLERVVAFEQAVRRLP